MALWTRGLNVIGTPVYKGAFSRDATLSLDCNDADIPLNVNGCAEIP